MESTATLEAAVAPKTVKEKIESFGATIENAIVPSDLLSEMIRKIPVFSRAKSNEDFISDTCSALRIRYYQAGDTIIKRGEIAKAMFFVIKGMAAVVSDDAEICFAELAAPSFFGEIGILLQVARTATVRAKSKCLLAVLVKEDLQVQLQKYPDVAQEILNEAKERYDALLKEMEKNGISAKTIDMVNIKKSLATGSLKDFRIARMGGKVNGECGHTNPHLEERIPSTMFINLETMSKSSSRATLEDDFEDLQDDLSPTLTSLSPQVSIPTSDPASSPSTVNQMISSPSAVSNPMISNMLMKHGALAPRRASVAVWSDDKLQQMLLSLAPQGASNSNSLTSGAAKISGRPGSSLNKAASFCSSSNNSISSLGNVLANEEVYGKLGKDGLLALMRHLDFAALFKMRLVSKSLMLLIKEYGEDSFSFSGGSKRGLFNLIDVSNRHKIINDAVLTYIAEFCGTGILHLSLKNCWSITDKGLSSLSASASCLKTIDLSSVWDSTDLGICTLAKSCPMITKIDLSNCRKLTDVSVIALLSSCPEINTIMLSYCKNLTDAIFDHIGWSNVKKLNIQRCTSIADSAFDKWPEKYLPLLQQTRQSNPAVSDNNSNNNNSVVPLHLPIVSVTSNSHEKLTSSAPATLSSDTLQIPYFSLLDLNLSDCSFLTDKTIITLCKACPELQVLSLSFCCALTEAAVENLTKSCLDLDTLDLSFCGTAVSDQSLLLIAKNLKKLSRLSIRGCVQATDVAVNQLAENAINLKVLNVSQCRNVSKTVSDSLAENGEKKIKFLLVRNQSGFGLLGSSTNQSSKNHDLASRARANTAKF